MIYVVMYSLPGDHPEKEWKAYTTHTVTCKGYDVFFKLGYTKNVESFKRRLRMFQNRTEGRVHPVCLLNGDKKEETGIHKHYNGDNYRRRKDLIEKYGSVECYSSIGPLYETVDYIQDCSRLELVLDAAELVWNNRICEFKNKISTIAEWTYNGEKILTAEHVSRLKEQTVKEYFYNAKEMF